MKYVDYQVWDFLGDEFFVAWVKNPTREADEFWSEWIRTNPDRLSILEEAAHIIQSVQYQDNTPLRQDEHVEMLENILRQRHRKTTIEKPGAYVRIAVGLAAAIIIIVVGYQWMGKGTVGELDNIEKVELITRTNPKGQKSTITLPDGSQIKLNAESSLTFESDFGEKNRIVSLSGEAFFEVRRDVEMPFIIRTGKLQTKVLGTSFDVRSYESEGNIQVVVVTGEVEVSDSLGTAVVLNPKEVLEYSVYEGNIKRSVCRDFKSVIGWKDGFLVFDNEPIPKVVEKLENWYGVNIEFAYGCRIAGSYTGEYHNKSLETVMDGISYASGFQYQIVNDSTLIISKRP